MSSWHSEWQAAWREQFGGRVEVAHPRLSGCCSARRADAEAGGDTVVEFQHSPISEKEVSERERDYAVHGKAVVWVLDAAAGATVS